MLVLAGGCSDHVSFPRFGGPHTSESCSKNGLERGGQDRKEGLEADKDVALAGAPLASAQKEGPRLEGGSEGRCWGHRVQAGQGTWAGTQALACAWWWWWGVFCRGPAVCCLQTLCPSLQVMLQKAAVSPQPPAVPMQDW